MMSARELVDRLRAYQPPNTNLGQHFLIDDDLLKRMVHIAEVDDNDHVLEIGPGPGTLTQQLLATGAKVTAIELDDAPILHLDNVFREEQEYYILFEISERKFKPSNSTIENEKYRIFEMKDLVTSEKYELEDFLKILKSGKSLNLTVRLKNRVIQGFNDLNSSFSPINSVIGDKF